MLLHRVTQLCPAKINFGLEVLERDSATGYHRVSTIMQAIDFFDCLELEVLDPEELPPGTADGSEPPRLEVSGPCAAEVPPDGNTMLQAWALMNGSQCFPPLLVRLEKNIPAGSGLGGGSSDGAGMLLALRELARLLCADARLLGPPSVDWPLAPDNRHSQAGRLELLARTAAMADSELQTLAARIGSDVPFFLGAPCALAEGFGERLTPLERRLDFAVLVAVPRFSSATAAAYRALGRDAAAREAQDVPMLAAILGAPAAAHSGLQQHLSNHFEPLVMADNFPFYRAVNDRLVGSGALAVSLTGSGSALYAVFEDAAKAQPALDLLSSCSLDEPQLFDFRYLGVHRPLDG